MRAHGMCVVNILDETWDSMDCEEQALDLAQQIQRAQKQPTGKSFVGPAHRPKE